MAKPRVFISSTYYDLKYVREDLERFIKSMGYEPIRHETGSIPYSKEVSLEESTYREVSHSDIIVCIIGGRFGTSSTTREGSITQNELEEALRKGVQVYIFIDQSVHAEYSTYELNKTNKDIKYKYVDDVAVYEFIEKLYSLPQNNPITPFSTSADICNFLQSQWAGLFQRYLQENKRMSEIKILEEMKSIADTLKQLVTFLTEEKKSTIGVQKILQYNNPVFRAFARLTGTDYRVFFVNKSELDAWLRARGYKPVSTNQLDLDSYMEWANSRKQKYIKLTKEIFNTKGELIVFTDEEWSDDWLTINDLPETPSDEPSDPPDLPF